MDFVRARIEVIEEPLGIERAAGSGDGDKNFQEAELWRGEESGARLLAQAVEQFEKSAMLKDKMGTTLMDQNYTRIVEMAGKSIDAAGVMIIVLGAVGATIGFFLILRGKELPDAYRTYRQNLGRAILLGLEFLVAGDIIRTVAVAPTLLNVGILGAIVAIRTFLSFSLQLELEGRLPWQSKEASPKK
ncbi:MAG: DUF1622 domain-containing protein [Verrucomicrobiota bacterium]